MKAPTQKAPDAAQPNPAPTPATPTLYKVLVDGKSWHGGTFTWSLPTRDDATGTWTPGAWHEVEGEVVLCQNGLHLTDRPLRWHGPDARIYEAEAEDIVGLGELDKTEGRKVAARRVRLLREVDRAGFEDADAVEEAMRAANVEARRVVTKANEEAYEIKRRARVESNRDAARTKRERTDRLRAATLTPAARKRERRKGKVSTSTAYLLVATAVRGRASNSGMSCDDAVYLALRLAIELRADFDATDVEDIGRDFHPHWGAADVALEGLYEFAAKANHAPALVAIERAFGRKPWVVGGKRLARDSGFRWEGVHVCVTTFDDGAGTLTACSYKNDDEPARKPCGCPNYGYGRSKIARRFKVTREAFDAAFPAPSKKVSKKGGAR